MAQQVTLARSLKHGKGWGCAWVRSRRGGGFWAPTLRANSWGAQTHNTGAWVKEYVEMKYCVQTNFNCTPCFFVLRAQQKARL
jgi:hypothetical protein